MTKDEIKDKLTELGIEFNDDMKKDELEALLSEEESDDTRSNGIEVSDPEVYRPKDLPLVVKLPKNASTAQMAYAQILNSYAYQNPEKWREKKDVLIKRLEMLKDKQVNESEVRKLSINESRTSFTFQRVNGEEIYAGSSLPVINS